MFDFLREQENNPSLIDKNEQAWFNVLLVPQEPNLI